MRTLTLADGHDGYARNAHHSLHVGHVDVDFSGDVDQLGDADNTFAYHIVSHLEGLGYVGVMLGILQQLVIVDNDHVVDCGPKVLKAAVGYLCSLLAFEGERSSHHGDHHGSGILGYSGHYRSGAGAGASAHADSDEYHLRVFDGSLQEELALLCSLRADSGISAGSKTVGHVLAYLHGQRTLNEIQRLDISISGYIFDTRNLTGAHHASNGVASAATHADHFDHGNRLASIGGPEVSVPHGFNHSTHPPFICLCISFFLWWGRRLLLPRACHLSQS